METVGIKKGRQIWIYMLAFLAARSEIAGMFPFTIAFFGAAYLTGCGSWGLYGALLLGVLSTISVMATLKYGIILILVTVGISLISSEQRQKNPLLVAGISGGVTMLVGGLWVLAINRQSAWYMPVLEGIAVLCFTLILEQALQVVQNKEDIMRSENLLSTLTLTAIILWGVPLQIGTVFTALQGVIYYLMLYMSYRYGVAYGTSVSTICGLILAIRTHQVEWVAICVILALVAAFLGEWGKWLEMTGFLAVLGFLGQFYYPQLLEIQALRGLISAAFLFLCTPKRYLMRYSCGRSREEETLISREVQKMTRQRLQEFAGVFTRISRNFCQPIYSLNPDGGALQSPVFARQMGEIGENISDFAGNMYAPVEVEGQLEDRLIHELERQNVRVQRVIMLHGRYGRKEIYLSARTIRGRIMTTREAAEIISHAMGNRYRVASGSRMIINREYDVIVFEEDTRYRYLTGVARVMKDGQRVSGDNFSQMELKNGQLLMLLADGVGSGEDAARQSEQLVDLLEEMLEVGFRKESAIEMLNELIAVQGQGEHFATLDLCMLDLYSGVSEFLKMGASTTYIQRGSWIETIQSTTLPMGIREQLELDAVRKKLYHGDRIIMVSDGVLDGIRFENKEECLKEMILETETNNPQQLAEQLLERVRKMNGGVMRDDASILVVGIWKK